MGVDFIKNFDLVKNIFKQADEKVKLPHIKNNIRWPR